jgi:hypothetical protein
VEIAAFVNKPVVIGSISACVFDWRALGSRREALGALAEGGCLPFAVIVSDHARLAGYRSWRDYLADAFEIAPRGWLVLHVPTGEVHRVASPAGPREKIADSFDALGIALYAKPAKQSTTKQLAAAYDEAVALLRDEKPAEALAVAEDTLASFETGEIPASLEEGVAVLTNLRGYARDRAGRDGALADWERACALGNNSARQNLIAHYTYRAQDFAKAASYWTTRTPRDPLARFLYLKDLALAILLTGDRARALKEYAYLMNGHADAEQAQRVLRELEQVKAAGFRPDDVDAAIAAVKKG